MNKAFEAVVKSHQNVENALAQVAEAQRKLDNMNNQIPQYTKGHASDIQKIKTEMEYVDTK